MADKRQRIDVTVELEDELSRPARTAASSVDELSDEVDELSASSAAATTQTNRLERALRALRLASGSATKEFDKTDKAQRRQAASAKAASQETDKLGSRSKRASVLMGQLGKVMKMLKFPAIAAAITLAATAVSSLGAAAFAAIAGLAPLVGVLGAMPALLLAVGTGVGATKLAFGGIGEALKVMTDNTKSSVEQMQALAKLGPDAQILALELEGVVRETRGWRKEIQAAALPGFTTAIRNINPLLPVMESGLRRAGQTMGELAAAVAATLDKGDLREIFATSNQILRTGLTPAMVAFTSIFQDFAVAGGPLAERFATWAGLAAERVAQLVDQGRQSGALTAFLDRAGDLAASLGGVVGDIAVGLFNIGKQAQGLAGSMGGSIADVIHDWRLWTESLAGQNAIAQWFADAAPLMEALGDTMAILADSFVQLAANGDLTALVNQINTELLPAMSNFAEGAASNLGPALVTLATAFIDFQAALSWSPLATMLQGIGTAAGAVLDVFNLLPDSAKTLIAALLILRTTAGLARGAMGLMRRDGGRQAGVWGQMSAGVSLYTENLHGMARAKGTVVGAFAGIKSAGAGLMGAMGGPWGLAIAGATIALGAWANESAKSKGRVAELTATLDENTGAFTANTEAAVARMLIDKGWDNSKLAEYGLTLDEVAAATLEGGDALSKLRTQVENDWNFDPKFRASLDFLELSGGDALARDLSAIAGEAGQARKETADLATVTQTTTTRVLSATEALRRKVYADRAAADGSDRAARAARGQGDAIAYTIRKVKELRALQMEALSAEIAYQQAKDDTAKALREGARTIDLNSQAGRDNVTAFQDLISAAAGLKNEAKRDAAIKESIRTFRKWGEESKISDTKIQGVIDRLVRTKEVARALDGTEVVLNIDVNSQAALDALERVRQKYLEVNGTALVGPVSPQVIEANMGGGGGRGRGRRYGGPVMAGETYRMGEVGPEFLLTASGVTVVGQFGQEQRRVDEPGWVLPNEYYEAARLPEAAPAPAMAASGGSHQADPVPDIHNHFHGDGSTLTPEDVKRASLQAWRQFERERRERRQGGF